MNKLIKTFADIQKLMRLPVGWDYGRGGPISRQAALGCMSVAQMLYRVGATDFDVVPGQDGAVTIFGYRSGEESVEIQCFKNGTFDFMHERGDHADAIIECPTISDLARNLEACGWRSPRFYDSCTRSGMSTASYDSPEILSVIPKKAVYRYLAMTVSKNRVSTSAPISKSSTTREYVVNRQYSGEYEQHPSQMAVA